MVIPSKSGELVIEEEPIDGYRFSMPRHNISLEIYSFADLCKLVAAFRDGVPSNYIRLLAKVSKLPYRYRSIVSNLDGYLFTKGKINKNADEQKLSKIDALIDFATQHYIYFERTKTLFVESNKSIFAINFVGVASARLHSLTYDEFVTGLCTGRLRDVLSRTIVTNNGHVPVNAAKQLKYAADKLCLPHGKICEIVQNIAKFGGKKQRLFLRKLEGGFSSTDLRILKFNARRKARYDKAGRLNGKPAFLRDTEELIIDCGKSCPNILVCDISSSYRIFTPDQQIAKREIGRYILERKWSKNIKFSEAACDELVESGIINNFVLNQVVTAAEELDEPYKSRLNELYAELVACSLKK